MVIVNDCFEWSFEDEEKINLEENYLEFIFRQSNISICSYNNVLLVDFDIA